MCYTCKSSRFGRFRTHWSFRSGIALEVMGWGMMVPILLHIHSLLIEFLWAGAFVRSKNRVEMGRNGLFQQINHLSSLITHQWTSATVQLIYYFSCFPNGPRKVFSVLCKRGLGTHLKSPGRPGQGGVGRGMAKSGYIPCAQHFPESQNQNTIPQETFQHKKV